MSRLAQFLNIDMPRRPTVKRIFNKWWRLFLRYAHNTVIPLAVLLIVGATLSWVAYDEYLQTEEFEFRLLEAHARNADARVAEATDKIGHLLNLLAAARLHSGPLRDNAFTATLDLHRQDIPELGTLLLTDTAGRIHSATNATLIGRDVSQEPYFAAHLGHELAPKLFMSRPDIRLLGTTAVIFTLPVVDADHRFLGVVGVSVGFGFFPVVLQVINPDDSASMSVICNRDGDLVYRRGEPEKFFGINIVKVSTIFREHSRLHQPVTRHIGPSAQDGKTRLFLVRDVGASGLSLILSRQLDEVLAKWQRNAVIYALIFLFTVVVVVFLAISAARRKQLEADVINSHKRLREIEQRQILSQERQRLMQDMHDGLGSSLISALRVVEHGRMDETEVAHMLKGCIDDLKLAIDSMEPVDAHLLLLLATLRFRLGPRLESTGIALHWEVQNVPDLDWLEPKNALHILRILQEAFANIIKHTQATEIRVATGVDGAWVVVTVRDNGAGFSIEKALQIGGKGLANQTHRAHAIGAEVAWASDASGTSFTLRLPIQRVRAVSSGFGGL